MLLDEIEKAHPDIYNILLQVMDHATLTDNTGRKADFRNVVLILTSNAGSREMSAATIGFADGQAGDGQDDGAAERRAGKSKAAIERVFSPEFRNRLDAIVTFKRAHARRDGDHRREVHAAARSRSWPSGTWRSRSRRRRAPGWRANGYDPVFGARPLARVIQREVRDPLTDEILFGKLEHGGTVTIGADPNGLTFTFAQRVEAQEPAENA